MASFTDKLERTWTVGLDVLTVKRVKTALDVSIADVNQALLDKIRAEPLFLADLAYEIVRPQAEGQGVDLVEFCRGLDGDAIDRAITALLEAIVDFCRGEQRPILRRALTRLAALERLAMDEAIGRLEAPQVETLIRQAIGSIGPASPSPDSPASSPGATASPS